MRRMVPAISIHARDSRARVAGAGSNLRKLRNLRSSGWVQGGAARRLSSRARAAATDLRVRLEAARRSRARFGGLRTCAQASARSLREGQRCNGAGLRRRFDQPVTTQRQEVVS